MVNDRSDDIDRPLLAELGLSVGPWVLRQQSTTPRLMRSADANRTHTPPFVTPPGFSALRRKRSTH